jgi:arylsulfatase A-like enzyme
MRPNILWICTDQQRFDTIASLGNPHIRTPNIDRLVADGVAFTHAYCQSPICTPSRASFLTGRYASTVHASMNGNEQWAEAAPLVTKLLKDAGYDAGLAGKFHLAGAASRIEPRPADDGYRVFAWSHDPNDRWPTGHAYADWVRSQGYDLGELHRSPEGIPAELHQTTWCANRAIEFMQEARSTPWLMSVNIFDPHAPFNPPRAYLERYDPATLPGPYFQESDLVSQKLLTGVDFQNPPRHPDEFDAQAIQAAYYAMIELIDDNVGRTLAALEASGQRENTVVIFMSDHGETLGDHGLLLKGNRFYEGLVRVPLIIAWPGHFQKGLVSDALVELTDLAPTLLELAGVDLAAVSATGAGAPEGLVGKSLLPILTGKADPQTHRPFVRCEYYRALNPEGPGRDQGDFRIHFGTMHRTPRYKLCVYHGHPVGELFDLELDPWEFENLWGRPAYAGIQGELLKAAFDALALATDLGPPQRYAF